MSDKPNRVPLTKEQKIAKLKQQLKNLQNEDKILERKNRSRNLVQIGAVVSSTISHQLFYDYLNESEGNKIAFIEYVKKYPFIVNNPIEK